MSTNAKGRPVRPALLAARVTLSMYAAVEAEALSCDLDIPDIIRLAVREYFERRNRPLGSIATQPQPEAVS